MKVIIVTGSVASGKTTLAERLSKKLNFEYLDVNKIINKISEGYDKKRKSKIIDVGKLNKYLIREISIIKKTNKKLSIKNINTKKNPIIKKTIKNNKKIIKNGIVIDSHLSHYLPKRYVDLCVVTKCDLKKLEKRLRKRGYSKEKIRENLDAEIFDICLEEAGESGHKVIIVDTGKKIDMKKIIKQINN